MRITALTLFSLLIISLPLQASVTLDAEDIWLRESVPGAENGAGFGTLKNISQDDIVIVGARANIARDVELHQHTQNNGQMVMEPLDALMVPAGEEVSLQPGGYHLMLLGLSEPLTTGDEHPVVLLLASGEAIEVRARVMPLVQEHRHE